MEAAENLEETYRNAGAAGFAALGVAFTIFALSGALGLGTASFTGEPGLSLGAVAVLVLGLATLAALALSGVLLARTGTWMRRLATERSLVPAIAAVAAYLLLLGVLSIVASFTGPVLEGDLPLGTLLLVGGALGLAAALAYRSHSASVAATGAIFGMAAAGVFIAVQAQGAALPLDHAAAGLTLPIALGATTASGLTLLAFGAMLYAYLWESDYEAVAHLFLGGSLLVVGLGLLITGVGAITDVPWAGFAELGAVEAAVLAGLAAGLVLQTVSGFLFLAAAGIDTTLAGTELYRRFSSKPTPTGTDDRREEPPTRTADASGEPHAQGLCHHCGEALPARARYCPTCGTEHEPLKPST